MKIKNMVYLFLVAILVGSFSLSGTVAAASHPMPAIPLEPNRSAAWFLGQCSLHRLGQAECHAHLRSD